MADARARHAVAEGALGGQVAAARPGTPRRLRVAAPDAGAVVSAVVLHPDRPPPFRIDGAGAAAGRRRERAGRGLLGPTPAETRARASPRDHRRALRGDERGHGRVARRPDRH